MRSSIASSDDRGQRGTPGDDRAQSELLGFLLIFGVVVLTIALIGLAGFAGLDGARDFQRTTNAEQAFTALADEVDDVVRGDAPSRSTEVRLAGGSLSLEPSETAVNWTNPDGTTNGTTVETSPIAFDDGEGTSITYRSGALLRRDGDSAVMFREPGYLLTEEVVVIPLGVTVPESERTVGGETAVDVRTGAAGTEVIAANESVDTVTLNLTTRHPDAWARYFEQFRTDGPVTQVDSTADSVEVILDTDRLYLTVHRIEVRLQ